MKYELRFWIFENRNSGNVIGSLIYVPLAEPVTYYEQQDSVRFRGMLVKNFNMDGGLALKGRHINNKGQSPLRTSRLKVDKP